MTIGAAGAATGWPAWVLAVDAAWLVVDKPAGWPTQPGRAADLPDSLATRAAALFGDVRVAHRLDMATSGLLVLARGAPAHAALSRAFRDRQVDKRYEAVVDGLVADDDGLIDRPLAADWPNRPRQQVDWLRGKPSVTCFRVLARDARAGCTRLQLTPLTGRSHQLRVHLLSLGHPILGDRLYGDARVAAAAPRLCLHATGLVFPHPVDGRPCRFGSPAPF